MSSEQPSPNEEPDSSRRLNGRTTQNDGVFQKLKGLFGNRQSSLRESLTDVLEEHEHERELTDTLTAKERSMLRNVLSLRERRVDDVMVPRVDIDAVEVNASIGELLKEFRDAGHSRLPVYRETLDDTAGMVHIKDLMSWITALASLSDEERQNRRTAPANGLDLRKVALSTPLTKTDVIREVLYVPPSMPAGDLLVKMQATRIHLAIVVDEYGGTDGLVSIEDLVEEIVGDIEDEHDEQAPPMIVPTEDGGFIADARVPLEELGRVVGEDLEIGELAEEIDTLGGLVSNHAGHLPVRGELVPFPGGFEFEVLEADPRRIMQVRIHRRPAGAPRPAKRERTPGRSDAA